MKSELCREIGARFYIGRCGELDLLPAKISRVDFTARGASVVRQLELEILPFDLERDLLVVDDGAAIAQLDQMNAQIEERVSPRAARRDFRRGQIAAAVLFDSHHDLRALDHQLAQFEVALEKRQHRDSYVNTVGVKQRRLVGIFQAVQGEIFGVGTEWKKIQAKRAELNARAGVLFELLDHLRANPARSRAGCEDGVDDGQTGEDDEQREDAQTQPAATAAHDPLPCGETSIFRRWRVS